ncbi:hypothetical protein [Microbispora sp. GKU 823]|uniref:hypothetical protein n=1 Tax=Microbispora sp. GKU 823 TaxID=1652100 RepID=UPI00117ED205|nr:hypothetical protein [Microbispora sp. GKU 823]
MEHRSSSDVPDRNEIAELRARADAGDQNAAGRLGELLARSGDPEGALRVWARAYGGSSPTTKRLAELKAEDGDLQGAVSTWQVSDAVRQNREGLHQEYLDTLDAYERLEDDDPEDWAFIEEEELTRLLAERGDEAAIAKLRAQADAGDSAAAILLARCEERYRRGQNATARSPSPLGE